MTKGSKFQETEFLKNVVSGIAHNINSPLSNIKTILNLLRRDLVRFHDFEEKAKILSYLEIVDSSISKIRKLITEIHSSSSILHPEKKQWFKLSDFEKLLNYQLRIKGISTESISFIEIIGDKNLEIKTYLNPLSEIIVRLIQNAIDHGTMNAQIMIKYEVINDNSIFSVTNSGRNIEDSLKTKMFEPFSTRSPSEHFGLGLFIVYNLVRDLFGGDICVNSFNNTTIITIQLKCCIR